MICCWIYKACCWSRSIYNRDDSVIVFPLEILDFLSQTQEKLQDFGLIPLNQTQSSSEYSDPLLDFGRDMIIVRLQGVGS